MKTLDKCYFCGAEFGRCKCESASHFGLIGFVSNSGILIDEPMVSESGICYVDPMVYYGHSYNNWIDKDLYESLNKEHVEKCSS